jgi:DNA repair photolyase
MRWKLAEDEAGVETAGGQGALFAEDEIVDRHVGTGEYRGLEFFHVRARSIINEVPGSQRLPFRWTINAYRGCSHACGYCFARPTHDYLGFDIGSDFDSKIVVKINAVERLRSELSARRWAGDHIAMGTNTDPYQRCEGKYHLTQGIIRTLGEFANPFSILTKSTLILRDLPLLVEAARRTDVRINFSIGTLDEATWKATEPGTPHPKRRVEAVRRINEAGIPCGVLVAPVIPGLSDRPEQVEDVVRACAEAGAVSISAMTLHLRKGVKEHWMAWLTERHPELVPMYAKTYRGAYAPKSVNESLSAIVRRVLAETQAHRPPRPWLPRREEPDTKRNEIVTDLPVQGTLL